MGAPPRVPVVGVPATTGKDGCRGVDGDSGIDIEDVCEDGMRNLGACVDAHEAGILFGEVVVVAVGVMSFLK